MVRRNFIKGLSLLTGTGYLGGAQAMGRTSVKTEGDRGYWLDTLLRVSSPVLSALSNNKLAELMPVEAAAGLREDRMKVTYLEALGRTLAGLAPWLESKELNAPEENLRKKFLALSHSSISNAVDPSSRSFMNFSKGGQPLVDAAFLAHALIRSPEKLWGGLDSRARQNLITALLSTRVIKPYYSNWLLFSAMIETALLRFAEDYDPVRIDYAVREHQSWYKGDGVYGDGPDFHFDYYNSYVIHPMLVDIVRTVAEVTGDYKDIAPVTMTRATRYAEIQERLIAPDGSFPVVGRSLAYRCGAFQALAQAALSRMLPSSVSPPQVRSAMTAMIRRTIDASGTFDENGWLTIGLAGHQPGVGERYISTGSLYLCTTAFLPLGLPEQDAFWKGEKAEWTSVLAFNGKNFPIDKAL
jgi:hypothetical protein